MKASRVAAHPTSGGGGGPGGWGGGGRGGGGRGEGGGEIGGDGQSHAETGRDNGYTRWWQRADVGEKGDADVSRNGGVGVGGNGQERVATLGQAVWRRDVGEPPSSGRDAQGIGHAVQLGSAGRRGSHDRHLPQLNSTSNKSPIT